MTPKASPLGNTLTPRPLACRLLNTSPTRGEGSSGRQIDVLGGVRLQGAVMEGVEESRGRPRPRRREGAVGGEEGLSRGRPGAGDFHFTL